MGTPAEPFVVDVEIDRASRTPLHSQIAEPLMEAIESGRLSPGTRLEDEVSMAERLQVSRPTARRALETLTQRGLIVRRRGAGTQVAPTHVHRPMNLTSLHDDLRKSGQRPRTSVLEWEIQPATPAIAARLQLADNTDVVYVRRLRMTDDEPLAILNNWLLIDIAPNREELAAGGLYAALRARGVTISLAVQQFGARLATNEEAKLLNEPSVTAVLTMQRTASEESGRVVEFGQHMYRASMYSYSTTVRA